jgi:Helix-turn-helix domain
MDPDLNEDDAVLVALTALVDLLAANERRSADMRERVEEIRRLRAAGLGYGEIVAQEEPPLIVGLLTESAQALDAVGARVRRTEAAALYAEGLTMDEIARHFGVTRQRISALLREAKSRRPAPSSGA